ncbi:MAG: carbohydrate binding family 9 domain-containing protein, partial [Acidobacteriota bacterium]|nr:carbohydrate binding family 9 domain-containing protein [Acidobacteriota bacterium]
MPRGHGRAAAVGLAAALVFFAAPPEGRTQTGQESSPAPVGAPEPAQSAAGFEIAAIGGARRATAVEAAVAPVLDGALLDDPAWALAPPASGFVQTQPDEGRPASERTEVRIVYTADTLYFGVVCYDDDPASIIVTDSRRDSSLADSDSFQLILDTFLDRQNGFIFGTSPSGQEYDGQLVNEGAGGSG